MKFIRYIQDNKPEVKIGWIYEDMVGGIEGDMFSDYRRLEATLPIDRVKLLAPLIPGKIVAVGWNYQDHVKEFDRPVPEYPTIFLKPPSAVIGTGDGIVLPPTSERVEHECELALVIGKKAKMVLPEEAFSYILGYTVANDVTARDLQKKDDTWTRSKGYDTFCPLGPWIETDFEPADAMLTCRVNSELRQMASTRDMVFSIPAIIAYISSIMTLNPGDVILTGTPAGTSPLKEGDILETQIEGIGRLVNPVVKQTK
ncbi:MAG TPA: fumarylacetoacetate hydrolase family protein [Flexilinea sp.]|jgi:2-keto-4-pentenoate hydratase/2-oxohepta-3-ene-1,7-dioic acid hydratase in catechol pathway|nr:fumarylacetoacetate hydrolase family protein [Flexilinea sp.]HPJ64357.1 fumarylacetoacetate hydrolase family protein [Flexilinea sp.]HPR70596.1 fumarylacetoacetate hydrolase family protein [Flexilinea sp.]